MKTLSLFALALTLGMGTASILHTNQNPNYLSTQPTNGAFRDGLFLGRLAAEGGSDPHIARGRWATVEDRASFTAGYRQGYGHSLATRGPQEE